MPCAAHSSGRTLANRRNFRRIRALRGTGRSVIDLGEGELDFDRRYM